MTTTERAVARNNAGYVSRVFRVATKSGNVLTPVDLTGASLICDIKINEETGSVVRFSTSSGTIVIVDGAEGRIMFMVERDIMKNIPPGMYYGDVLRIDPDPANPGFVFEFQFPVVKGYTEVD